MLLNHQIDDLIEQHVFGNQPPARKRYSSDSEAAYDVMNHINKSGKYRLTCKPIAPGNIPTRKDYVCEPFENNSLRGIEPAIEHEEARAICMGALRAYGVIK